MKSGPRRAFVGFLLGLGLWVALAPIYNPIVATGAEILIQFAEHPNVTSIETLGRDAVIHRAGFDPRSSLPQIAISDLTFNFVVLLALFGFAGFERKGQRDLILLVAFTLLFSGQVLGVVAKIMSIFVLNLGEWSKVHYSPFERNFWATAYHFYRFVGGYAIAFVIWWWLGLNEPDFSIRRAKGKANKPRRKSRR